MHLFAINEMKDFVFRQVRRPATLCGRTVSREGGTRQGRLNVEANRHQGRA